MLTQLPIIPVVRGGGLVPVQHRAHQRLAHPGQPVRPAVGLRLPGLGQVLLHLQPRSKPAACPRGPRPPARRTSPPGHARGDRPARARSRGMTSEETSMRFALRRLGFFAAHPVGGADAQLPAAAADAGQPRPRDDGQVPRAAQPAGAEGAGRRCSGSTPSRACGSQYVTYLHDVVTGNFGTVAVLLPVVGRPRSSAARSGGRSAWSAWPRCWPSCWAPGSGILVRLAPRRRGWTASCRRCS